MLGQWMPPQKRWFELRHGSDCFDSCGCSNVAVLHYTGRGDNGDLRPKQCTVVSAKRHSRHDCKGWSCISLVVSDRKSELHLLANNEYQAHALLAQINSILNPIKPEGEAP